ncbi:Hypothetical protein P9211_18231 [Prochlorococcus marinus str. MIT 9211]|uniref:Uncharacterized protein n=1 Tax=Prochlorococcus marinus (strain MIT 9211) TaxID=93059 RepID=A9BDE1_PROM4|nr:Hypothetical protein P9211_18231 [Prochlorococcus marinus str. MIT 9211]
MCPASKAIAVAVAESRPPESNAIDMGLLFANILSLFNEINALLIMKHYMKALF